MILGVRLFIFVSFLVSMFQVTSSQVYTSSLKMERMVMEEELLLKELMSHIENQYEKIKILQNYFIDRLQALRVRNTTDLRERLKHPNAMYHVIKNFYSGYRAALGENFITFTQTVGNAYLAGQDDMDGTRLALLRLQDVYNLTAADMINGEYLGFKGPPLEPMDAFWIGVTALSEKYLNESLEWFNASLQIYSDTYSTHWNQTMTKPQLPTLKTLMGRAYLLKGDIKEAERFYDEAIKIDPENNEARELRLELDKYQPELEPSGISDSHVNVTRLCRLDNGLYPAESTDPRIVCRFREALLPYYRFKEELLSISPFVSVIYGFCTDSESEFMKTFVQNKLMRGRVDIKNEARLLDYIRTADLAWITDDESEQAKSISLKIQQVTGLDTSQGLPDGSFSAENFQVVNYGLGGHYAVHMDVLNDSWVPESGNRMATFLMYLTDVERGGSTIFTQLGLSVAPKKNMALFWYNYNPAVEKDFMTFHAGCPVLYGHKWISNKWIWTHGNTFRRRCGLTSDATQLDIEVDMKRGYK